MEEVGLFEMHEGWFSREDGPCRSMWIVNVSKIAIMLR